MPRFFATLRAVLATSGRHAAKQSLAAYLGLALSCAVLFGGNGLDAHTLTSGCQENATWAIGLTSAWLLFSLPATKALLTHESACWLRSMPLPRGTLSAALLGCLFVVQAPWLLLWARGTGVGVALSCTAVCISLGAALIAGSQRPRLIALALGSIVIGGVIVSAAVVSGAAFHTGGLSTGNGAAVNATASSSLAGWLALPLLLPAALYAVRDVWFNALSLRDTTWSLVLRGPALVHLIAAYVRTLARSQPSRLLRSALYFLVAGVLSYLAQIHQAVGETTQFSQVSLGVSAVLATATLFPAVLRSEHGASWLLATSAAPRWLRRLGALGAHLLWASGLTLVFSTAAQAGVLRTGSDAPGLLAPGLQSSLRGFEFGPQLSLVLCLSVFTSSALRRSVRPQAKDAERVVLVALAASVLGTLVVVYAASLLDLVIPALAAALIMAECALRPGQLGRFYRALCRHPALKDVSKMIPVLRVDAVYKRLGRRPVLNGISFECAPGQRLALVGANGAGKTTLLQLLSGQLQPDAGEIWIAGHSLRAGAAAARANLGYVPDSSDALAELSAQEFVALVRALKGAQVSAADAAFEQALGFASLARRRMGELSFGQRKRVCLLAALAGDPQLLVLDEPSNGLDPEAVAWVAALLQKRAEGGQCSVFSTNDLAFLAQTGASVSRLHAGELTRES